MRRPIGQRKDEMRTATSLIIAIGLMAGMLSATATAFADEGAPVGTCQPGTANAQGAPGVGEWQLLSQSEYAELLRATFGEPSPGAAEERAEVTYAFCDKNDDGYACVLKQTLPANASGITHALLTEDNHYPFPQ
jgi:hypothetical protein